VRVARFLAVAGLASVLGWLAAACAPAASAPPAAPVASVAPTTATAPERQPPAAEAATSAPPAPQALKFADVPSIALAPLYIASERGYFAAEGLYVELEPLAGGADAVALLGTGQIDANAGAVSAGTFNAVQRGVDIRIVAPMSFLPQSGGATPLLIRKDLAEQVRSPAEMKGRRVAINVRGGANEYLLAKALAQGGLAIDDVDLVLMPFPDVPQALTQGAVDFALPAEPFATRALEAGGAAMFLENIAPGLMNTVVFFSARLRAEQPRAAQGFLVGLMRAARDLQGAAAKSNEHIRILAQYTRLSPEVLRASAFNAWDPDLRIHGEDLLDQQRVHIQNGRTEFTEPLPLDRLVDERFQAAALQTLGPAAR
jgi:NitT/TauT family transport system substrate-binding protein